MKSNLIKSSMALFGVLFFSSLVGLAGCDDSDKGHVDGVKPDVIAVDDGRFNNKEALLPFRLAFKLDGTPVILDEKGNIDIWEKAKLPLETRHFFALKTVSIAVVEGSCTVLVSNADGSLSQKQYPSKLCKFLGIPEN